MSICCWPTLYLIVSGHSPRILTSVVTSSSVSTHCKYILTNFYEFIGRLWEQVFCWHPRHKMFLECDGCFDLFLIASCFVLQLLYCVFCSTGGNYLLKLKTKPNFTNILRDRVNLDTLLWKSQCLCMKFQSWIIRYVVKN